MYTASTGIPSFVRITPFGPYCGKCGVSLPIEKGIQLHARDFHPDECSFNHASVVRSVKDEMKILRERHCNDYSVFLKSGSKPEPLWFCSVCFLPFGRNSNYQRHIQARNGYCQNSGDGGRMDLFSTICGRKGPRSIVLAVPVGPIQSGVPPSVITSGSSVSSLTFTHVTKILSQQVVSLRIPSTLMHTHEEAVDFLSPFVREDEDAYELSLIYSPLLGPSFEGTILDYITYSNPDPLGEDPVLVKWMEAGTLWLNNYAAPHIANVSANVRSRLAEFEQKELDGAVVSTGTFVLRRGIPRLISELHSLLRFLFRYPTVLFQKYKKEVESPAFDLKCMIEHAIVPRILYTAVSEEPLTHGELPLACRYALSLGFSFKKVLLTMNVCGWFSSRISALMHLLRAGVCGYLVTLSLANTPDSTGHLSSEEMEIVRAVQNGRVTNLLAPYVKRLRDMNCRKPVKKTHTVNGNGDITCGAFTFVKTTWSTIIPRLLGKAKECFRDIILGDDWQLFLNRPVMVKNLTQLDVFVRDNERQVFLQDVKVQDYCPLNHDSFATLQAILELCLFGLGTGAVRFEELGRLKTTSCQWHNSYVYYCVESQKQGNIRVRQTPKIVEHRLSLSLSRAFLLIRRCIAEMPCTCEKSLLPSADKVAMLALVQDLFDFDHRPEILQVRHLFTSIGNIIMPERTSAGGDEELVSSQLLTEKSGHTQGTARRAYSTTLLDSEEALYDFYHKSLGEVCLEPPHIDFVPFSESILKSALQELVGKKATYRHSQQWDMVETAANNVLRHSYVGLPCGHGKSMSWMVPIVASFLAGRHVGLRIVVLPYKFLLGHLVDRARSQLGVLHDRLTVEFLSSSDIEDNIVPSVLMDHALPCLLFLNLDAAVKLLQKHMDRLQKLAREKLLKTIYVDEIQQFLCEYSLRTPIQSLCELGRVGVPVLCLSGSLPTSMAMQLMTYFRLRSKSQQDNSVHVIDGLDPVGDGFTLDVTVTAEIGKDVAEYIKQSKRTPCHVICSTKDMVREIAALLSPTMNVLTVTGESSSDEQFSVSNSWSSGKCEVLVSTTVALVGNENSKCRTIVIAGVLFDVSSLVQAFGRLRPEQRGVNSVVSIFHNPIEKKNAQYAITVLETRFRELKDAGCLDETMRKDFINIFSNLGLLRVLNTQQGCYLKRISSYFGYDRTDCERCSLCRTPLESTSDVVMVNSQETHSMERCSTSVVVMGKNQETHSMERCSSVSSPTKRLKLNPAIHPSKKAVDEVTRNKVVAEELNDKDKEIRRAADFVFNQLKFHCLHCKKADCYGERCVNNKNCFKCGVAGHHSNKCIYTTERLKTILPNKGVCFGCYDVRGRPGHQEHDMKLGCPLHRRLKRLLLKDFASSGNATFELYLRKLYASDMTFLTMLSKYSKGTELGR